MKKLRSLLIPNHLEALRCTVYICGLLELQAPMDLLFDRSTFENSNSCPHGARPARVALLQAGASSFSPCLQKAMQAVHDNRLAVEIAPTTLDSLAITPVLQDAHFVCRSTFEQVALSRRHCQR